MSLARIVLMVACLAGTASAQSLEDVRSMPACTHCGMDREKFAQSRMVVEYDDGTSVGLCSLHCAAVEFAVAIDKRPKAILVADRNTLKLVDAEKAVWVIGGAVPGVMTSRAKWAFAEREAANAFVKVNGGTVATFDEAIGATYEDMYQDTKRIRERRKARQKAGRAIAPADPEPSRAKP